MGPAFIFTPQIKYLGSTPGADGNTYVLFATVLPATPTDPMNAGWPECSPSLLGIRKIAMSIKHNNTGTVNIYASKDRGVTWRQMDTQAIAAPGATGSTNFEHLIESYRDFKVEWVNGGSAQSPFEPNISFSPDRASPL